MAQRPTILSTTDAKSISKFNYCEFSFGSRCDPIHQFGRHLFVKLRYIVYILLILSFLSCSTGTTADEQYLFDFSKTDGVASWQEQSDTVRDVGMSKGILVLHRNVGSRRAIFFALLNPQLNGAGFAGIRAIQSYDLTGHTKLQIKCRGQGQYNGFKVILRHKGLNDEPNYSFEQYFQVRKFKRKYLKYRNSLFSLFYFYCDYLLRLKRKTSAK